MTPISPFFPVRKSAKNFRGSVAIFWQRIAAQMVRKAFKRGVLSRWPKSEIALFFKRAKQSVIRLLCKENWLFLDGQGFLFRGNLHNSKMCSVAYSLKDIINGL